MKPLDLSPPRRHPPLSALAAGCALFLVAVALATHFVGLGERAMSHDESIHAQLSWQLFENGTYTHDPAYHGPFLFHVTALVFSLAGDTDFTARLTPALSGVALVVLLLALRRTLGSTGALCAAALVAISPSILFYGRYLRNDVYMALFAVVWVLGLLRYLERRDLRGLTLVTLAMAASFAAKEVAFLTGASLGLFLVAWSAARHRAGVEPWRTSVAAELAAAMLLVVLPFAAPLVHLALGWDPLDWNGAAAAQRALISAGGLAAIAVAAAWALWGRERGAAVPRLAFHRWLGQFALFWGVLATLFSSGFRVLPRGLVSGVVGSLGYWLVQHDVERGGQPGSYYSILLALYEFLPLLLGLAGGLALLRRGVRAPVRPWAEPSVSPAPWLFAVWALTGWIGYSIAGEKMPWLTVHIALPLCLLGGRWLGEVIDRTDFRSLSLRQLALPAIAPVVLLHCASRMLGGAPRLARDPESIAETARFGYAFLAALAALLLIERWLRRHRAGDRNERRLLGLGFVAALALFTVQTSWRLAFRNHELATELMVYAHATPDIKRALAEIDELGRGTGAAGELRLAYDAEVSWPFDWYLRHDDRKRFLVEADAGAIDDTTAFVLAGGSGIDRLWPLVGERFGYREMSQIWWPLEELTKFDLDDVARTLADPAARRAAWRYVAARELAAASAPVWPNRKSFRLYVRRGLVERSWAFATSLDSTGERLTELRVEPTGSFEGPFAGLLLANPAGVAVRADGARLVADSGRQRVLVLSRDGDLLQVLDGDCDGREDCVADPFREPWGVASSAGDRIAVADTWNGRVRTFDGQGTPLASFGSLSIDSGSEVAADRLYGPRALAFDAARGALLVVDTGHHRIVEIDARGESRAVGRRGSAAGELQEPVGIAVDPADGTLLVADAWNRRILRLGTNLEPLASWPVPGWKSRGGLDKPYLAADRQGRIYASDPGAARVLVFARDGAPLGALVAAGWRGARPAIPIGVAIDLTHDELVVADAGQGRIWTLPLWPEAAHDEAAEARPLP